MILHLSIFLIGLFSPLFIALIYYAIKSIIKGWYLAVVIIICYINDYDVDEYFKKHKGSKKE